MSLSDFNEEIDSFFVRMRSNSIAFMAQILILDPKNTKSRSLNEISFIHSLFSCLDDSKRQNIDTKRQTDFTYRKCLIM
jgi:hypothetical protein